MAIPEGTPMTFHEILFQLQEDPMRAKQFVVLLCQEGYLLGMKSIEDMLNLPDEDLTAIAVQLFPKFFLRESDTLNQWKH